MKYVGARNVSDNPIFIVKNRRIGNELMITNVLLLTLVAVAYRNHNIFKLLPTVLIDTPIL